MHGQPHIRFTIMTIHCSITLELGPIRPHNWAPSDRTIGPHQTTQSSSQTLHPHLPFAETTHKTAFGDPDRRHLLHALIWGMYTFHLKAFRLRRTLVLLTPVSHAHCVADFRGDVINLSSKTIAEEAGLVAVRGLADLPLCTSQMVQYHVYQTCHKAV